MKQLTITKLHKKNDHCTRCGATFSYPYCEDKCRYGLHYYFDYEGVLFEIIT